MYEGEGAAVQTNDCLIHGEPDLCQFASFSRRRRGRIGFSNAIGRPEKRPEKAPGRARRGPKYASLGGFSAQSGPLGARGCRGIGNPTTRAPISSLQPPSKPAFCLRRHDHWADHWASPGPDDALTRPFGATGSATSTACPTARSRRRPVCPLTNRCVDRARHRVLPGLTRPSAGRLGPPARHHLHPVRHTRPTAVARVPGRWAAPGRPRRCAPGSA